MGILAGLAENRCLERREQGAQLLQVGEQEIAFGAKFRARVVLDIKVGLGVKLLLSTLMAPSTCVVLRELDLCTKIWTGNLVYKPVITSRAIMGA